MEIKVIDDIKTLSATDLQKFYDVVLESNNVEKRYLKRRIRRAKRLVWLEDNEIIVGTCGIKIPSETYKNKVFHDNSENYKFEFGWLYLKEAYRGKEWARKIINYALKCVEDSYIFGTCASDNNPMISHFQTNGFSLSREYTSSRSCLPYKLFVRGIING